MNNNIIEELTWRNLVHNMMPGTQEVFKKKGVRVYIGFDPTSDSLHIGSLVQIMLLMHLQKSRHHPIVLIGGATGMIGDPSGKSKERTLLDSQTIQQNVKGIQKQLSKFIEFDDKTILLNNYDWFKDMDMLTFLRDVGKVLTVNYMMGKESVKQRLEQGISYTEFTYQLIQGYDFYYLNEHHNCEVQMGGSDQWGNMLTGTELVRRLNGKKAYALTTELIKKADGSKFGKTASGNVWLDKTKTSVYHFYQYWLNVSDEDAGTFIKIFTFKNQAEIQALIAEHQKVPHLRLLQKELAKSVTTMVHSEKEFEMAQMASTVLFQKGGEALNLLNKLDEQTFNDIFQDVPNTTMKKADIQEASISVFLENTGFFSSKSEIRRALNQGSIMLNKNKVNDDYIVKQDDVLKNGYILLQKGKKNYYLIKIIH